MATQGPGLQSVLSLVSALHLLQLLKPVPEREEYEVTSLPGYTLAALGGVTGREECAWLCYRWAVE